MQVPCRNYFMIKYSKLLIIFFLLSSTFQIVAAETYFDQNEDLLRRISINNIQMLIQAGDRDYKLGFYKSSLVNYDKALASDPSNVEALTKKGRCLNKLGRYDEAISCCEKVLELDPSNEDAVDNLEFALNEKASDLEKLGLYDKAIDCYEKVLELDSDDKDALNNIGNCYRESGKSEEALNYHDRALELDSKYTVAWNSKGDTLGKLGRYDEARKCYEKVALDLDPYDKRAWNNIGYCYRESGKPEDALQYHDRALDLDQDYATAWYSKGLTFKELKQNKDAIRCYEKAIKLYPKYTAAWYNKGVALNEIGKYKEAEICYEEVTKLDSEYIHAWCGKGDALTGLGKYQEAILDYDVELKKNPECINALCGKGNALSGLGQYEQAISYYNKVFSLDPYFEKAQEGKKNAIDKLERENKLDGIKLGIKDNNFILLTASVIALFSIIKLKRKRGRDTPQFLPSGPNLYEKDNEFVPPIKSKEGNKEPYTRNVVPPRDATFHLGGFPSRLLSKYEPLEMIGEGGFAKVFKAKRKEDGKVIALKVPQIDESKSSFFINEVAAWYNLSHPNIVMLYKADMLPVPYLEMEYVEGVEKNGVFVRELGKYPKPLSETEALKIIRGIAAGLSHAHSMNVYHRDIKPMNVLLQSDLNPKITDFGIAKLGARNSFTSHNACSLMYAAPEQIDRKTYGEPDYRTDIYQLGVVFYELLCGELPYNASYPEEILFHTCSPDIRPVTISEHRPEFSLYDGVFEKLLEKRKENRFQNVADFMDALEAIELLILKEKFYEDTLSNTSEFIATEVNKDKIHKLVVMAVEMASELVLLYAKSNYKPGLIKHLKKLCSYTLEHKSELSGLLLKLDYYVKEGIPVGDNLIEGLEILLANIEMEVKNR